jgi:hypothetical protein
MESATERQAVASAASAAKSATADRERLPELWADFGFAKLGHSLPLLRKWSTGSYTGSAGVEQRSSESHARTGSGSWQLSLSRMLDG